ncbi:hypothetical protein DFJ74DRAFT_442201 [Hyaloraphidium curvatum]|nr:hypothetical protein DFJ74DRAFT_442201 [Hyaloraphidium curvatum]
MPKTLQYKEYINSNIFPGSHWAAFDAYEFAAVVEKLALHLWRACDALEQYDARRANIAQRKRIYDAAKEVTTATTGLIMVLSYCWEDPGDIYEVFDPDFKRFFRGGIPAIRAPVELAESILLAVFRILGPSLRRTIKLTCDPARWTAFGLGDVRGIFSIQDNGERVEAVRKLGARLEGSIFDEEVTGPFLWAALVLLDLSAKGSAVRARVSLDVKLLDSICWAPAVTWCICALVDGSLTPQKAAKFKGNINGLNNVNGPHVSCGSAPWRGRRSSSCTGRSNWMPGTCPAWMPSCGWWTSSLTSWQTSAAAPRA